MSKGRLIVDLQKWFWMDVLITSTYGRLLDDLDRRHKNFHNQTILSWSHNVYDKPPTDVIWRFFAHWDATKNITSFAKEVMIQFHIHAVHYLCRK